MEKPLFLFAHGAGAASHSPWMQKWARLLATLGNVYAFDYPYMHAGRKRPDPHSLLLEAHREALVVAQAKFGTHRPLVLIGKSMGARIGCHLAVALASEGHPASHVVCLGYPLRAAGSGAVRDAVLYELQWPILFLQGGRDALCPLPDLEGVRGGMRAPSQLVVMQGGDHSLDLRRRSEAGKTAQAEWDAILLRAIQTFITPEIG